MKTWIIRFGLIAAILGVPAIGFAQQRPASPERARAPEAHAVRPQGWLGIAFRHQTAETGGRTQERTVVAEVHPGSPAARAGLQRGDTIVQMNGRTDVEAQVRALRLQPGDTVRVRVRRQGQRDRDMAIVADRRPEAVSIAPRGTADRQRVEVRGARGGGPGVIVINGDTVRIPVDSLVAQAGDIQRRIRVLLADSLGPRLREMEREIETVRMPQLQERLRTLDTEMARAFPDGMVFEFGRRAVAGAEFSELNAELASYFQGAREGHCSC